MIRLFALLVLGVLALSVGAWYVNDEFGAPEPRPTATVSPPPSQADRLMAFCDKPANRTNPLCKVDPNDPDAVKDAVDRIVEQAPRIIERERANDDDDDGPDIDVIVPSDNPTSQPAPSTTPTPTQTTRPPLVQDIVIPELPGVPPVDMPDLPIPLPLP